jgi:glycerol-3-phosphate dehydrogenase (NAD(P)+)
MESGLSENLAVVGAGSWGTALAIALAPRFGSVRLWARRPEQADAIHETRENALYLAGFPLPANVSVTSKLEDAVPGAQVVILVVPSRFVRGQVAVLSSLLSEDAVVLSATKGLENGTLFRMSQVIRDVLARPARLAVLSGPTFAHEVAAGEPAAVVVASDDIDIARQLQPQLSGSAFRVYASDDVIGVETGAALKNVIAIASGICQGLGLGSNTVAALITRGLAEITRLAVALGGRERTLAGLAGLGDLVLTTTGDLSRNRAVGLRLGRGESLDAILASTSMVAEGVVTCKAAHDLARKLAVPAPIISEMFSILYENQPPRSALQHLMDRPLTRE